MQDASELRRALAAHLDYYRELGIAGISRDPIWTARRTQTASDRRVRQLWRRKSADCDSKRGAATRRRPTPVRP